MEHWAEGGYPLNANPTKWSNTLKTFRRLLPTNCLSVLDHFVGLAFKGLSCKDTFKISHKSKAQDISTEVPI